MIDVYGHQDNALAAAAAWLERLLLGGVGTSLAVVAIAILGLMMLGGRLPMRRGMSAVLGCFILFGSPIIVRGIMGGVGSVIEPTAVEPPVTPSAAVEPVIPPPLTMPMPPPPPSSYDPYAGAAVPR